MRYLNLIIFHIYPNGLCKHIKLLKTWKLLNFIRVIYDKFSYKSLHSMRREEEKNPRDASNFHVINFD